MLEGRDRSLKQVEFLPDTNGQKPMNLRKVEKERMLTEGMEKTGSWNKGIGSVGIRREGLKEGRKEG